MHKNTKMELEKMTNHHLLTMKWISAVRVSNGQLVIAQSTINMKNFISMLNNNE